MPNKKGSKWRTLNKFGKKKRRSKKGKNSCTSLQTEANEIDASIPGPAGDATSDSAPEKACASAKKLDFFKPKKRKCESSEDGSDCESTEEKKAKQDDSDIDHNDMQKENLNLIIDINCLQSFISESGVKCSQCRRRSRLTVREGGAELRMGSSCVIELCCSRCGSLCTVRTSEKTGIIHTGFDINRRIVAAATASGMGFAQTKRFFAHLSMPQPMNEKTFHFYKGRINAGVNRAANKHLQKAAEQVRAAYADMNIGIPDRNGILNISISIDGTWQKRGRTSHNGVVTVIEILTGLVVDFIAMSNFCQMCETGPQPDDDSYDQWWEGHKNKCQKNIDCSSAAMEVEGARAIFKRSVQLHGFRYTEMLGDGDAKTHAALLAEDPYGGYPIEKIDCVNHVTKRLGTALRNLVQTRKAQHAPIHGRGKLTEERIKKLTNYYGRAIKDNSGDLEAMERAVWASFFHTMSADENHNHTLCPTGLQSWCFFQRAQAENVAPRPHSKSLPPDVAEALDPVYKRLGDPQLLRRCLAGKTQNSNECFHSLLWSMCPKERWASLRTVDTALGISVQRFNKGSTATADILVELELMTSRCTELYAEQEDLARVQSATRKNSNKEREKRKRIDIVRRRERQDRQGREGEVYGPGQF